MTQENEQSSGVPDSNAAREAAESASRLTAERIRQQLHAANGYTTVPAAWNSESVSEIIFAINYPLLARQTADAAALRKELREKDANYAEQILGNLVVNDGLRKRVAELENEIIAIGCKPMFYHPESFAACRAEEILRDREREMIVTLRATIAAQARELGQAKEDKEWSKKQARIMASAADNHKAGEQDAWKEVAAIRTRAESAERERDALQERHGKELEGARVWLHAQHAELIKERDQLRAELARLREREKALREALQYADRCCPPGSHAKILVRAALAAAANGEDAT